MSVFRSHKHIYAQIIDDEAGRTLAAASTKDKPLRGQLRYGGNKDAADGRGQGHCRAGPRRPECSEVVFDRREYRYHGRVAALAEAARKAGLQF